MADFEKECRYSINSEIACRIKKYATIIEEEQTQKDLAFGYFGFYSLEKNGYVCRVRQKGENVWMEIKRKAEDNSFLESKIPLDQFKAGIEFFSFLGMKPYLYINKKRTILKYKKLKIFIDDIEGLGIFVEIEFQNSINPEKEIQEFTVKMGIKPQKMPLYGDIIFEKMKNDNKFKNYFDLKLKEITNEFKDDTVN